MEIIPVIDILNGSVVHARYGQREAYRALETPLSTNADPLAVLIGLYQLGGIRTIYIADLDALMGKARQIDIIGQMVALLPDLTFWVDAGFSAVSQTNGLPPQVQPVIGTESLTDDSLSILAEMPKPYVLSLDFKNQSLMGPTMVLERTDWWPEHVILMNLSRVGSNAGPDFDTARSFKRAHPRHEFVAAGGIRDASDLVQLQADGISCALVASALHTGVIDRSVVGYFNSV